MTENRVRRKPEQSRSAKTREAILRAALMLIEENGVNSITTNHIARRADVSISSVYHQFSNKISILQELYRRKLSDIASNMDAYADEYLGKQPWHEFFPGVGRAGSIDWHPGSGATRLWGVSEAFPDLKTLTVECREAIIDRLSAYLRAYGAALPSNDLRAAARLLNELHETELRLLDKHVENDEREALLRFSRGAQKSILCACGLE